MNPRVKSVTPIDNYQLNIVFTNGEEGIFDCSQFLEFGVFQELKDHQYFKQVSVFSGTVVWPHDQDICPDTIYSNAKKLTHS